MRQLPPPVFSRRSFLFFILLAPACLLAVAAIVVTLQYKQFQALVSDAAVVEEFAWTEGSRQRLDALLGTLTSPPSSSSSSSPDSSGRDTVRLAAADLTLLAAASPVLAREGIRFRFTGSDSQLVAESSQRVEALSGRFAWIFKRITPVPDGWLNARMEGLPEWKTSALGFAPERSFLNGAKVPRAAMSKRGGLSPKDFIDPAHEPEYTALVATIDTVLYEGGETLLIRKR
jgi:hypothetical protein